MRLDALRADPAVREAERGGYFPSRQSEQKALQAGTPMQHSGAACRGQGGKAGDPGLHRALRVGALRPRSPRSKLGRKRFLTST